MSGKKNRRRSSLAPNRVSMVTTDSSDDQDLHRLIDPDLPAAMRLAKLTSLCLQHTVQNMDMTDCQHSEWFKSAAQEKIGNLISQLQEDGVFEQACQTNRLLPNPVNENLDARLADAELTINGLKNENKKWDDILNELDGKVKQAELEKEKKEMPVSEIPDRLKIQSRDYYSPNFDYQAVVSDVQQNISKAVLIMEESCSSVNLLHRTHQSVEARLQAQCNQLWKESFEGFESPRKQIQNQLSVPVPASNP